MIEEFEVLDEKNGLKKSPVELKVINILLIRLAKLRQNNLIIINQMAVFGIL